MPQEPVRQDGQRCTGEEGREERGTPGVDREGGGAVAKVEEEVPHGGSRQQVLTNSDAGDSDGSSETCGDTTLWFDGDIEV